MNFTILMNFAILVILVIWATLVIFGAIQIQFEINVARFAHKCSKIRGFFSKLNSKEVEFSKRKFKR